MASIDRQKIVIDTDCGIDDALAILLALSSKDVAELLAVTCCFGNTNLDNVCSNVMRVLTVCDEKKIPIHRGCRGPLLSPNATGALYHAQDGLGECSDEFSTGGLKESDVLAPVALIDLAKKHPKQITLIAIGPLTNVAIAHKLDPKFTENLKSLVIMGGNYKGIGNKSEVAEFNFLCDPEAADIILSEAECSVVLVPWETSIDYGIKWELYKGDYEMKRNEGKFFKLMAKFEKDIGFGDFTDSDFLAAVSALYPECVKSSEKHFLAVEVRGQHTRGLVVIRKNSLEGLVYKRETEIVTDFHPEILKKLRKMVLENVQ